MAAPFFSTPFQPYVYQSQEDTVTPFQILGGEAQVVQIMLKPQEKVIAKPGSMCYMSGSIGMENTYTPEQEVGVVQWVLGKSVSSVLLRNTGQTDGFVGIAAPSLARILPIDLAMFGGDILCQPDAFLCSVHDVKVVNSVYQRHRARNIAAAGAEKNLEVGEVLTIDVSCIAALTPTINFRINYHAAPVRRAVFGGDNVVTATLTGPGIVFIQSLPFHRLSQRIARLKDQSLLLMMRQLHAVYGEWLLKDGCWNFVVDHFKGAIMLFLSEGSTHADLVAMAQEDYNLDMNTESVELTYSLQHMAPDLPPIHVISDRQVRNLLEITKTHELRLCVSSFSKMRTVSEERDKAEERDEADVGDEAEEGDEADVGDEDEEGMKLRRGMKLSIMMRRRMLRSLLSLMLRFIVNMERIYVNQSFATRDALLSELRLTAVRRRFSFRIYKSTKTFFVATCRVSGCQWKARASVKHGTKTFWVTKYVETHTCSITDRIAQRKHCTPKYIGRLFIDRVGIIDGLNPQHIKDAMKNMVGMTLDYTTSYRALLYAQEMRGSGRQKKSRWQSWLELSRMRGRTPQKQHMVYRCSVCKEIGHKRPQYSMYYELLCRRPSGKSSRLPSDSMFYELLCRRPSSKSSRRPSG
ncbi:hypothetical protein DY000_02038749 [Brassica cretica]|uniref:Transposase MuDR plant domain-containing protein n=1 Tax=Brassica cretica TaxID=69181 RepID=A0ABQ7BCE1_BRACR|nr:hypothetical protein DY000_02038749 [Brassica cretica]